MKTTTLTAAGPLLALALAAAAPAAWAQAGGPVVYPARDQSPKQQERDRFECFEWAKGQSGFDPTLAAAAPGATATPMPTSTASPTGAMAGGALGGAAIAELTHADAGRGAAIGALGGGLAQRMKQQQATQARQQQAGTQQAQRAQAKSLYDRAYGACLEARGYVLK